MRPWLRRLSILAWLLLPIGVLAWHHGPGQRYVRRDAAAPLLAAAERTTDDAVACEQLSAALARLGPEADPVLRTRVQLAHAQRLAQSDTGLLDGLAALDQLQTATADDQRLPRQLRDAVRAATAIAHHHTAWRLRLAGADEKSWLAENHRARQHLRLLTESAADRGAAERAQEHARDLEQVIRMQLLSDDELRALPLPQKCGNCQNIAKRRKEQRRSRNRKQSRKKKSDEEQQQERELREELRPGGDQAGSNQRGGGGH
ncbi:MAG: hypothetical protein ACOCYV_01060 [Planctomycetota bacterium]